MLGGAFVRRVLLGAVLFTTPSACTSTGSPVSPAEAQKPDHNVYRCEPFGAMTHAEVLVNDQCIGTAAYHGFFDRCHTRPWVEAANAKRPPNSKFGTRPLLAMLELHYPERFECIVLDRGSNPQREAHRQSIPLHPDYFPHPDIPMNAPGSVMPDEQASQFKAVPDEKGWSFTFKGKEVTRIERSAAAAGFNERRAENIRWEGSVGEYGAGQIECSRGIGKHLRTLCRDPTKSIYQGGMSCVASTRLDPGSDTAASGGVDSPYYLSIGYAHVQFEALSKTQDHLPDAQYFRETGRPPPSCANE